jgi:hypothetical protein
MSDNVLRDRDHKGPGRIVRPVTIPPLPWDVLEEILLHTAHAYATLYGLYNDLGPSDNSQIATIVAQNILQLSHVCHTWRTIMLNTPQFWAIALPTHWDIYLDILPLQTFLERSKGFPLCVHLACFSDVQSTETRDEVLQHAHRIQTLDVSLHGQDEWKALAPFFERADFPLLETLSITSSWCPFKMPKAACVLGLPRLRELTLSNFKLTWPAAGLMKGLTKFSYSINFNFHKSGPTLAQLLEGLRNCPSLEHLELSSPFRDRGEQINAEENFSTIHLPHLKYIKMDKLMCGQFIALMAHIIPRKDVEIILNIFTASDQALEYLILPTFQRLGELAAGHHSQSDILKEEWSVTFRPMPSVRCFISPPVFDKQSLQARVEQSAGDDRRSHYEQVQQQELQQEKQRIIWADVDPHSYFYMDESPAAIQVDLVWELCSASTSSLCLYEIKGWDTGHWTRILDRCVSLQAITLGGDIWSLCGFLEAISPQPESPIISVSYTRPSLQHVRLSGFYLAALVPSEYATSTTQEQVVTVQTFLMDALERRRKSNVSIATLTLQDCIALEGGNIAGLRSLAEEVFVLG